ncbi:MAG TPA: hypothetical protein VFZ24_00195 [Longimicrobiales bacterium]
MQNSTGRQLLALGAAALLAGCGSTLGGLGDVLGGIGSPSSGNQGQLAVQIQSVNTSQQVIQVATEDGQVGSVRYDQNTVVVYRQQQYPVTALERGDIAVMQLQDVGGALYVSRIDVQQSVQERAGGGSGNLVQLSGTVSQIDHNRGTFVLLTQGGSVTVTLPYNPPQATLNYFHSLRNGNTVRLEATQTGTARVELHRFL